MKIIVFTIGTLLLFLGILNLFENLIGITFAQDDESANVNPALELVMNTQSIQSVSSYTNIVNFNTNFTVTGDINNIIKEENLTKNTIIDNFSQLPTIGYIKIQEDSSEDTNMSTLPNPFASKQQIEDKISLEFDKTIKQSEKSDTTSGTINCHFGMNLADFRCDFSDLIE